METAYNQNGEADLFLEKVKDLKDLTEKLVKLEASATNVEMFSHPVMSVCGTFNR